MHIRLQFSVALNVLRTIHIKQGQKRIHFFNSFYFVKPKFTHYRVFTVLLIHIRPVWWLIQTTQQTVDCNSVCAVSHSHTWQWQKYLFVGVLRSPLQVDDCANSRCQDVEPDQQLLSVCMIQRKGLAPRAVAYFHRNQNARTYVACQGYK